MRELDRGPEIAMPRRASRPLRASRRSDPSLVRRLLCWVRPSRPADTIAVVLAAIATAVVLVNALMLQPSRHATPRTAEPARPVVSMSPSTPPQKSAVKRTVAAPAPVAVPAPLPPPRPEPAAVRTRSDLVADMQRELRQLGLYEGTVDGLLGSRTEQAIRAFEQAQGLKISGEPSPMLLDVMRRARPKTDAPGIKAAEPKPSTRVLAVQRVLARLGYGPVGLTGLPDAPTRNAIEKFERDRGMPRSGEIGDRLITELATVTGTPVE